MNFGRFAEENSKRNGKGKPETFDFLGFTHYCSKSNKTGKFRVKRKTSRKKMKQKIKEFSIWAKESRNKKISEIMETVKKKLIGHYNYYGITDNSKSMMLYYYEIRRILFKWLNRRSQKKSYNYESFDRMWNFFQLPLPHIKVSIYDI